MDWEEKQGIFRKEFSDCKTPEEIYYKIMEFGKKLPAFHSREGRSVSLVKGCQSQVYIEATFKEGNMHFQAFSDSLISAGLAAVLTELYSNETPQSVLQNIPSCLEEIGINNSLTPSRANGLASIYLHLKQATLPYLMR